MEEDIDLYQCEIDDLKEHIGDIRNVTMDKLQFYYQQMVQLIDDQKNKDKQTGNLHIMLYNASNRTIILRFKKYP